MLSEWLGEYCADGLGLLFNLVVFTTYLWVQNRRIRNSPSATLQSEQIGVRAEWVKSIMAEGEPLLGIQTLRNAMMGSIFFASNTMFLVIGTLSLTAQRQLAETWSTTYVNAAGFSPAVRIKLIILLLILLAAFFCYINAIRLFEHASVSIGVRNGTPARVTLQINRAWWYQAMGIRCYYFAAPILFWLFGAVAFVLAGLASLALMRHFDNLPSRT
jgi:uncharacterized membrane protein